MTTTDIASTTTASVVCAFAHHFTGKERDSESGNDYFGARYYGSSMGRFLSPDWSAKEEPVPYAKLDNPQSLNLYSYVYNNPLSGIDPDGHQCGGGGQGMPRAACDSQGELQKDKPQSAQQQGDNAKERAVLGAEATGNLATAVVKFNAANKLSKTGELGAAGAFYLGISAAGNLTAAGVQATGAVTGETHAATEGAEIVSTVTTGLGLGEFVISGGNLDKAANAAAIEGLLTSNPKDLIHGGTPERIVNANEYRENLKQLWPSVKAAVNNWLHPISVQ